MADLASEAQFTYWGALSFYPLLLNPYPYLRRLLPNKYLCSVPMLTLSGALYTNIYFGVLVVKRELRTSHMLYTHYTTESHPDSNTSAFGTD